jgi:hypothetical protein
MTCEICGTTANVMRVLLWQRERHDYCTSCAAQVRPIPLGLSETWKRELPSAESLLVAPFYVCACGTPLMPLIRSACAHVDRYRASGDLVEEHPRCRNCGEEFVLFVSDYVCDACRSACRPTFPAWEPRLAEAVFRNAMIPYVSEEFRKQVYENPN